MQSSKAPAHSRGFFFPPSTAINNLPKYRFLCFALRQPRLSQVAKGPPLVTGQTQAGIHSNRLRGRTKNLSNWGEVSSVLTFWWPRLFKMQTKAHSGVQRTPFTVNTLHHSSGNPSAPAAFYSACVCACNLTSCENVHNEAQPTVTRITGLFSTRAPGPGGKVLMKTAAYLTLGAILPAPARTSTHG